LGEGEGDVILKLNNGYCIQKDAREECQNLRDEIRLDGSWMDITGSGMSMRRKDSHGPRVNFGHVVVGGGTGGGGECVSM
jgi:hypothetical protein